MPTGRVWMYKPPHSGGQKIPDHVRLGTAGRIEAFAREHFAGRYRELAIRGQFCYIDGFVDPDPLTADWTGPGDETAEEYQARLRDTPVHLCRLRFNGDPDRWTFAFYSYASGSYEPSMFLSGDDHGTPRRRSTFPLARA